MVEPQKRDQGVENNTAAARRTLTTAKERSGNCTATTTYCWIDIVNH